METLPATQRLPRHTTTRSLGHDRRCRFLLQFDDWRRKFRTLGHALVQAGLQRCVYYDWKTGKRVPQEAALRRVCERIGIDSQYVLTGIPGKVGDNHLTLCFYQQQHKEAATAPQRSRAFVRIVTESFLVLQTEFPSLVLDGIGLQPEPIAILKMDFNPLLGFAISIQPDGDVFVGFEVSVLYGGMPEMSMAGRCDEGTLRMVRQHLRDTIRMHVKKRREDDVLTPHLKKEAAYNAKHNARHNQ